VEFDIIEDRGKEKGAEYSRHLLLLGGGEMCAPLSPFYFPEYFGYKPLIISKTKSKIPGNSVDSRSTRGGGGYR